MTRSSPRAVLAVVAFGVFVAADDLTVVATMLRPIIGDLRIPLPAGLDDAAWIVNAYLIAYVAIMPIAGRLSDVWGRRRVFVTAMAIFLVGSIWVPLAPNFQWFLAGRVLSAIGGGALVPLGMAAVGDVYAEGNRARALGTLGAIDTLGWVWGPLYGAMLVRFLSWQWQFYLNVPLAIIGIVVGWRVLADLDQVDRRRGLDWVGASLLTVGLVALNIALLGGADIQSVSGFDELLGRAPRSTSWLYWVSAIAFVTFVWWQRRDKDPLIDLALFKGRMLSAAVVVNFLVGAVLVIAMVDVPLFVNVIELDLERSAVIAGWVLSSLTASMAIASYLGGKWSEVAPYRTVAIVGLIGALVGFALMGSIWGSDTGYLTMAWQLAILGAGIGLVTAPVSAAVIDSATPDQRGAAAGLVIVFRLLGLSVGLSALTAWGLHRYVQLRDTIELPPLGSEGYEEAVRVAQTDLTTGALAETFVAAAVVVALAIVVSTVMSNRSDSRLKSSGTRADR
ncbi:MAG: MFS transporter [Acidimicrobiia bacterium]|nr:MFS transporter [Acidimicrobiia bacterium]